MPVPGNNSQSRVTPISRMRIVGKSNTAEYEDVRGIMIGGSAGTVNLTMQDDVDVNGVFLQPGIPYPFAIKRVRTGGTSTGSVILLY